MKIRETHKVVVMGAGGVGKTALVVQFMEGFFSTTYKPTVEDFYRHTIQLPDGAFHTVEILDTSGTHTFTAMRELNIKCGRAFILVFSLDSLASLQEIVALWKLIEKVRGNVSVPVVLVGNKSDLNTAREVSYEAVLQMKEKCMNNCPYIETSAKYNENVARLFMELLQQAKTLDGTATPELKRHRKLSRRLSSFSSLPNITLIRRKSSGNSTKSQKNGDLKNAPNGNGNGVINANGNNLLNNQLTGSLSKLVDNCETPHVTEIKRHILNGVDTISLTSDGGRSGREEKCAIL